MEIDKENVFQAVVIMDTFNNHFNPISDNKPMVSSIKHFVIFFQI